MNEIGNECTRTCSKFPAEGSYLTYAISSKLIAIPRHKLKKTYGRISPWMQYLFNLFISRSQLWYRITVRRYSPMVVLLTYFRLLFAVSRSLPLLIFSLWINACLNLNSMIHFQFKCKCFLTVISWLCNFHLIYFLSVHELFHWR